jgi:MFS family permease
MRTPSTGLWQHGNFRRLWAGQTVSQFGSQLTEVALPLTAALALQASAVEMGLLGAAATAPVLFLGLFAGVWVDRRTRRPLLIAADLGRAVLLLPIPLLAWLGALRMEVLYAVAFGVGALTMLFELAYQAFLPSVVSREELVEGNSKLEVSRSAARVAGPGVAGVLVDLISAPMTIVLDALSFLGSAFFLARTQRVEAPRPAAPRRPVLRDIGEGLRLVGSNPILRAIAGCTTTANLFRSMLQTVLVLYLTRDLGAGAALVGAVFAASNLGFLAGALVSGRAAARYSLGKVLIGATLVATLGALLVPVARGPLQIAVPLLVLGQGLGSLGAAAYSINQLSLRQAATPDHILGRVSASMRFFVIGILTVGALVGGALGELIGLWSTVLVASVGQLFPVLWLWFSPIRGLRSVADAVPDRWSSAEAPSA